MIKYDLKNRMTLKEFAIIFVTVSGFNQSVYADPLDSDFIQFEEDRDQDRKRLMKSPEDDFFREKIEDPMMDRFSGQAKTPVIFDAPNYDEAASRPLSPLESLRNTLQGVSRIFK